MATTRASVAGLGIAMGLLSGGPAWSQTAPTRAAGLMPAAAVEQVARLYATCGECDVTTDPADGSRAGWRAAPRTAAAGPPVRAVTADSVGAVAVVTGEVTAVEVYRTPAEGRVFTAYGVRVATVTKGSTLGAITAGDVVVVTQPGGTVVVDGAEVTRVVPGYGAVAVGVEVAVTLLPVVGTGTWQAVRVPAGWLLRAGGGR